MMAVLLRGTCCRICKGIAPGLFRSITVSAPRNVIEIKNEADFKEKVLGSKKPVVVDFHAECV